MQLMIYHGHQFRQARAAIKLPTREICRLAAMSMGTLGSIEAAAGIEYGTKQAGRFSEVTIAKLVSVYEAYGVTFLPPSRDGAGIRYRPPG